jgi:hypothetical protein
MKRLIFVPQYPSKMRYQEWWFHIFPIKFRKYFDQVIVLGKDYLEEQDDIGRNNISYDRQMFSPIEQAIYFETIQINEYMDMRLQPDDTLFLADLSFPGFFSNVLYHKRCEKMFAFCHATSLNKHDYFSEVKSSKFKTETAHANLFEIVFFGSRYSWNKTKWDNGIITALPEPPDELIYYTNERKRDIDILSVCRPSIQKVNLNVERFVEKTLGIKIHRQTVNSWKDYSSLLSRSKILLITTKEDTFNYTILDAVRCGCIPLVPNKLCFPEILPPYWRYDNKEELTAKIFNMLNDDHFIIPEILCQNKIDSFFDTICEVMKE